MPPLIEREPSLSSLSGVDDSTDDNRVSPKTETSAEDEKASFEVLISKDDSVQMVPAEYEKFPDGVSLGVEESEKGSEQTRESENPIKEESKMNAVPVEDVEEEDEEITPDHWYADGAIPVFKPVS